MTIQISRPSFVHEDNRFYQFFSKLINSIEVGINLVPDRKSVNNLAELSTFNFYRNTRWFSCICKNFTMSMGIGKR